MQWNCVINLWCNTESLIIVSSFGCTGQDWWSRFEVSVLWLLAMLGNGYKLNSVTEIHVLKVECRCTTVSTWVQSGGCPVETNSMKFNQGVAVKPLEHETVPSYGYHSGGGGGGSGFERANRVYGNSYRLCIYAYTDKFDEAWLLALKMRSNTRVIQ